MPFSIVMPGKHSIPEEAEVLAHRFGTPSMSPLEASSATLQDIFSSNLVHPVETCPDCDPASRHEFFKVLTEGKLVGDNTFYKNAFIDLGDASPEDVVEKINQVYDIPNSPNVGGANILKEYAKRLSKTGIVPTDPHVLDFEIVASSYPGSNKISLYAGIKDGSVRVNRIQANGYKAGAISILVENTCDKHIEIRVESGMVFEQAEEDTSRQNLAVDRTVDFKLPKGEIKRVILDARCMDQGKGAPSSDPMNLTPFLVLGDGTGNDGELPSQHSFWQQRENMFAQAAAAIGLMSQSSLLR